MLFYLDELDERFSSSFKERCDCILAFDVHPIVHPEHSPSTVGEHCGKPCSHYKAFGSFKRKGCPVPSVNPCVRLIERHSLPNHSLEGRSSLCEVFQEPCQRRGDGIGSNATFISMSQESIGFHSNSPLQQVFGLHSLCLGSLC